MTDNKSSYSIGIVLLAMLLGLVLGIMFAPKLDPAYWGGRQETDNLLNSRVNTLMHIVDEYYVDTIDYDSLSNLMMNAMLSTLDPHSCYLSPEDFAKESEMITGTFEGIGVTLFYYNDTVYANNVIAGGPASQAGIQPGDRIMYVDTTLVSGVGMTRNSQDVISLIRGPRGSSVTLAVQRGGSTQLHKVKVQRNVIPHTSIPAAVMLDRNTGYILISRFAESTGTEFHTALQSLLDKGMKRLVLDLRNNGGGSLASAIEVCDELLPRRDLIVYTQGAHERRHDYYATSGGLFEQGGLTVMVNEHSASASEIVSGAIQDNDRGTVVGRRTFGKGLVQRQFDLPGEAAALLTIARYYTPSGRCIQRPYAKGSDDYYLSYLTRLMGDLDAADSVLADQGDTSECYLTKQGRKVYGGGGILPDRVLTLMTDTLLVYYNNMIDKNVFEHAVFDELFAHCDQLRRQYPDADSFVRNFRVSDTTWQRILHKADAAGLNRNAASIAKYGDEMRGRYKALLAFALYGDNAYYQCYLPFDSELTRTVNGGR